jgi:hypothetical protein
MRQARRAGDVMAVAVVLGLCVLAGCSNSHGDAIGRPTTISAPTSTTTSTSTTTPTTGALSAYRASWSALEGALADANPSDPALAATMVDPQLQAVKANLLADQRQGVVGRGPTTLHPKVTSVSAATATVVDCTYSATELVYRATGKPVPPVTPPENDGVTATLVFSGGAWKVSKQTVTDGKCAPGS